MTTTSYQQLKQVIRMHKQRDALIARFKTLLRLNDWNIRVEIKTRSDIGAPAVSWSDATKREAVMYLRDDVAYSKEMLPYLVAHELCHVLLSSMSQAFERATIWQPQPVSEASLKQFNDYEESVVHDLVLALGVTAPPASFWVGEKANEAPLPY